MNTIEDVIEYTSLKEPFIRRCLNEIHILKNYMKRGDKNKILLDSNAVSIFDNIKQYKEKGLSISEINKQLSNTVKQTVKHSHNYKQTENKTFENQQYNEILSLTHKIYEVEKDKNEIEKDKIKAEHELDLIKSNLKLLPAGGDVEKSKQILSIISKLEVLTRPKGFKLFSKTKEIDQLWIDLKELL